MKLVSLLASCLTVLAIAGCGGSDNNNTNGTTQFTLTLNAGSNGTLAASPAGGKYDSGTDVTLTATPAAGFKVAAWTGTDADTSTSPTNHVTMSADKTVSVTFTAVSAETFTLTITQNEFGTVTASPAGPTYSDGTTVTLTAAPTAGYEVDAWTGTNDDTVTGNSNAVTMTANKTVGATFKIQPAQKTLTVVIDEGAANETGGWGFSYSPPTPAVTHTAVAGNLTFSKTFDEGTTVTLTGLSAAFWPVTGWSGTDVPAGHEHDCTITLTMDVDRSVTINIPLDTEGTDTNICP